MDERIRHSNLTKAIIGVYYDVYKALGHGFLYKVYEIALAIELRRQGLAARQQEPKGHEAQFMSYLKATEFEVGLQFNFGSEPRFVRKIFDNSQKGSQAWTNKANSERSVQISENPCSSFRELPRTR